MTKRAGDTDTDEVLVLVEDAAHAHHGVGPQQLQRGLGAVKRDGALAHDLHQQLRDARDVGLEAGLERLVRAQTGADAAQLLAENRSVKLELAAPEGLAAERV